MDVHDAFWAEYKEIAVQGSLNKLKAKINEKGRQIIGDLHHVEVSLGNREKGKEKEEEEGEFILYLKKNSFSKQLYQHKLKVHQQNLEKDKLERMIASSKALLHCHVSLIHLCCAHGQSHIIEWLTQHKFAPSLFLSKDEMYFTLPTLPGQEKAKEKKERLTKWGGVHWAAHSLQFITLQKLFLYFKQQHFQVTDKDLQLLSEILSSVSQHLLSYLPPPITPSNNSGDLSADDQTDSYDMNDRDDESSEEEEEEEDEEENDVGYSEVDDLISSEIYSWGVGAHYALGNATSRPRSSPLKVSGFEKEERIKECGAGKTYSLCSSFSPSHPRSSRVWIWGTIPFSLPSSSHPHPQILDDEEGPLSNIYDTVNTSSSSLPVHSPCINISIKEREDNTHPNTPPNLMNIQNNNTTTNTMEVVLTPREIMRFSGGIEVKEIACGSSHVVLLTNTNCIYTFGDGLYGKLGHGDQYSLPSPRRLKSYITQAKSGNKKKKSMVYWRKVAVGDQHTVALDMNGYLYTWGSNLSFQTGHFLSTSNSTIKCILTPRVVGMGNKKFVSIGAGKDHTVALSKAMDVFWIGSGYSSIQRMKMEFEAGMITYPSQYRSKFTPFRISSLSSGSNHVCFTTLSGDLYSLSPSASSSQLPLPTRYCQTKKTIMTEDRKELGKIKKVYCGGKRTVVEGEDGEMWEWDSFPLSDPSHISFPSKTEFEGSNRKWSRISIGEEHSVGVIEEREESSNLFRYDEATIFSLISPSTLSSDLSSIRQLSSFSDLSLTFPDCSLTLPVHRCVLAVQSPALAAILQNHTGPSLEIHNGSYKEWQYIMDWIYSVSGCTFSLPAAPSSFLRSSAVPLLDDEIKVESIEDVNNNNNNEEEWFVRQIEEFMTRYGFRANSSLIHTTSFPSLLSKSSPISSPSLTFNFTNYNLLQEEGEVGEIKLEGLSDSLSLSSEEDAPLYGDQDDFDLDSHSFHSQLFSSPFSFDNSTTLKPKPFSLPPTSISASLPRSDISSSSSRSFFLKKLHPLPSLLFRSLFSPTPLFTDFVIRVKDGLKIECHKAVLYTRCDYFAAIFSSPFFAESQSNSIDLQTVSFPVCSLWVEYLYTDRISWNEEQSIDLIVELYLLADEYLTFRLRELCEQILISIIDLSNVIDLLELAESTITSVKLKEECMRYLVDHLAEWVLDPNQFLSLPLTTLLPFQTFCHKTLADHREQVEEQQRKEFEEKERLKKKKGKNVKAKINLDEEKRKEEGGYDRSNLKLLHPSSLLSLFICSSISSQPTDFPPPDPSRIRSLRKKYQQILRLEGKRRRGEVLREEEEAKLLLKHSLSSELCSLARITSSQFDQWINSSYSSPPLLPSSPSSPIPFLSLSNLPSVPSPLSPHSPLSPSPLSILSTSPSTSPSPSNICLSSSPITISPISESSKSLPIPIISSPQTSGINDSSNKSPVEGNIAVSNVNNRAKRGKTKYTPFNPHPPPPKSNPITIQTKNNQHEREEKKGWNVGGTTKAKSFADIQREEKTNNRQATPPRSSPLPSATTPSLTWKSPSSNPPTSLRSILSSESSNKPLSHNQNPKRNSQTSTPISVTSNNRRQGGKSLKEIMDEEERQKALRNAKPKNLRYIIGEELSSKQLAGDRDVEQELLALAIEASLREQ